MDLAISKSNLSCTPSPPGARAVVRREQPRAGNAGADVVVIIGVCLCLSSYATCLVETGCSPGLSLEVFAFDNGERLANVVDAGDAHATSPHRSRAHRLARSTPPAHVAEATTQCFIDQVFQADTTAAAQSLESGGYIIIEGQRGSHHHHDIINLMF